MLSVVVLLHYCYVDYEKCSDERLCPASPRLLLWTCDVAVFAGFLCGVLSWPTRESSADRTAALMTLFQSGSTARTVMRMSDTPCVFLRSNQLVTCPWKAGKSLDQVLYEFVGHGGIGRRSAFLRSLIFSTACVSWSNNLV